MTINVSLWATHSQERPSTNKNNNKEKEILKLQEEMLFPSRKAHEELQAGIDSLADRKARAQGSAILSTKHWTEQIYPSRVCNPHVLLFRQQASMDMIK